MENVLFFNILHKNYFKIRLDENKSTSQIQIYLQIRKGKTIVSTVKGFYEKRMNKSNKKGNGGQILTTTPPLKVIMIVFTFRYLLSQFRQM